jgi:hypothetical protein
MGGFSQVEFDSLAPYEQKQYEMDNPRPRASRQESMESSKAKMNSIASPTPAAEKAIENYRAKVGSDAGGRTIGSGGGGGGGMGTGKMNRDISKNMKKGGKVSSASKRADGCAIKGKTRGRIV